MDRTKITFCSSAFLVILLLISCAKDNCLTKMEEEHIATIKYIHAEVAKGNIDAFDEVLAPDYVRHCQAMPLELQEMHGGEQLKAFVGDFISSISDLSETFDVIVADGDKVAYVSTMTATQSGPMGGLPASGKTFICVSIIVQRFENGKIAETWITWDNVAMLSQLGFFPPPATKSQP